MSAFEAACWNWYMENMRNQAMMDSGAAGHEMTFALRRLPETTVPMFKRAMNAIYQSFARVDAERARKAQQERS